MIKYFICITVGIIVGANLVKNIPKSWYHRELLSCEVREERDRDVAREALKAGNLYKDSLEAASWAIRQHIVFMEGAKESCPSIVNKYRHVIEQITDATARAGALRKQAREMDTALEVFLPAFVSTLE